MSPAPLAASLSLLAGGKSAVGDELKKPDIEAQAPAVDEITEAEVDIDVMTSEQLDALVKKEKVKTPTGWAKLAVQAKRDWLYAQYAPKADEAGDGAAAEAGVATESAAELAAETKMSAEPSETAKAKPKAEPNVIAAIVPKDETESGVELTKAINETVAEDKGTEVAIAKPKGKAKAVAKAALNGEVVSPDALTDLVHEIENLKEKQARELVGELAEQAEVTFFRLGGVLSVVQANGWYKPFASFREFVEKEHGIHYRKATYWVGIYNELAESKVPWEKVKGLGWTKLKEIASVLTPDNVDEWVKIAMENTTLTLMEIVANSKKSGAPKAIEDNTSKVVTTMTFKVHEDQKAGIEMAINKAKTEAGTQVATVALEAICMDYMSAQTMVQKLKAMGAEAALKAIEQAYPDLSIEVTVNDAEVKAA